MNRVFLSFVPHEAPNPPMNAKQKRRVDATGGTNDKKTQHSHGTDDEMMMLRWWTQDEVMVNRWWTDDEPKMK